MSAANTFALSLMGLGIGYLIADLTTYLERCRSRQLPAPQQPNETPKER